ncbi:diphthine--ammonia ligase [Romboutsia sp. CE17]|uniref:Dph6-related ATP pyrophosphatase n=1 Tax=Romboutsia sp. CE17 TaxID=2724150 RepID=UPI001442D1F6|nr:diphthine--ammonia ligase [Romboutsia sp. CE17]QJA08908.1 diphthine--ammonia ligase [Romboutsia sp. CE17]
MNNKKFVISFSGGKDSMLALHRMIKNGYTPVALLTTVKKNEGESWTHGINLDFLNRVSKSLGIDLITVECGVSEYESEFERKLLEAKEKGATICVYGDIDIEHHRQWGVDRCNSVNMNAEFPLWQENREDLVYEFIDNGYKAIIKTINLNNLGEEFLGEILTKDLIQKIKETGSDACGENGEYHTFVSDGPLFKIPINFEIESKILDENYGRLNIK